MIHVLPLMVMLSEVVGAGGGGTPLVTGFPGVLNIRSVKEKVPLSTVISLKRLSSFHAAVSSSNNRPANQNSSVSRYRFAQLINHAITHPYFCVNCQRANRHD